eukprot:TRINITY_DN5843_c1_g1_i1.p1 TRINITY_DN5843_c1_g1~~TRINITY_DN5843_c1_g1_i1.p1  ORF type:complete len:120 (-),score=13.48 TRINITY_DN5843_c1_g1_i1:215-574(-)
MKTLVRKKSSTLRPPRYHFPRLLVLGFRGSLFAVERDPKRTESMKNVEAPAILSEFQRLEDGRRDRRSSSQHHRSRSRFTEYGNLTVDSLDDTGGFPFCKQTTSANICKYRAHELCPGK